MVKLPGLTPFAEDRPMGGRPVSRKVPQQDVRIQAPGLRLAASPVDTYSRPAAPQRDTQLDQFIDGLSTINPALQRFGSVQRAMDEDTAETRARRHQLEAISPEDYAARVEADPVLKSAIGRAAAQRVSGMQNSTLALADIQNAYVNDFDKANGDFDAFVAEKVKPYLGDPANDPSYVKSFMASIDPSLRQLRAGYTGYKAQEQYAANQQTLQDAFLSIARNGAAAGATPEEQAKAIFREFYGNKRLLGMSFQDQGKAAVQLAATLAEEGNYDLVTALATMDRTGADGAKLGKLLDDNQVGGDMAKAVLRAKAIRDGKNQEGGIDTRQSLFDKFTQGQANDADEAALRQLVKDKPGLVSEGWANGMISQNRNERERLKAAAQKAAAKDALAVQFENQEAALTNDGIEAMKSGKLFSLGPKVVIDKEGNEKTILEDDVRQRAVDDYAVRSAAVAKEKGETREQTILRDLPIYAANGVPPKSWRSTMERGVNALSTPAVLGGEIPQQTVEAYSLFKLLRTNKSQLLRDLLPKDKADVFETARISEEELGMDPTKALLDAVDQNADPAGRPNPAAQVSLAEVRKAADTGSMWNSIKGVFGGGVESLNESVLVGAIQRRAEVIAGRGVNADKAIELAAERVRSTHVNVNGWWIDASDKRLPPNFPDLATEMIREYVEKHGKTEGIETSDLTVFTAGNGGNAWRIVVKAGGWPVDNRADSVFTSDDLMAANENRIAEINRMKAEDAANAASTAYEPWFQLGNPDGPADIHLGPFLPKNWRDPAVQEQLRQGRREKGEKQRAAVEALGSALASGAQAVTEAAKQGAADAVAPMVDAIKNRKEKRRAKSQSWRAQQQTTEPAADQSLEEARGQLDQAKARLLKNAEGAVKSGADPKVVAEGLRKAGIDERLWPK
ncbi:hypothetical protein SAMN02745157_4037 [Kaistia soli DSM 19436]|uniref:Uncharacterized protein n=1 Tax=Kaistia soli DSM 19436 TaxID=1122133 RepID=A0A1M5IXY5_9HYPH|nr:hypothetical protein [Kaistia soli]SHG33156.1 hypothetical protein SAMN02745157_4037 [Kaistia soli DSM 19436]